MSNYVIQAMQGRENGKVHQPAKVYQKDGSTWVKDETVPFDWPTFYAHGTIDILDLASLRDGLEWMSQNDFHFVWGSVFEKTTCRRNQQTCVCTPRPYVVLDVDKGSIQAPGCTTGVEARAWWENASDAEISAWTHEVVLPSIPNLPPFLKGVQCIVRPSSSCWLSSATFRGHIWMMLDRIVDFRAWKNTLESCGSVVDTGIYTQERIIFLSPPNFIGGSPWEGRNRPREWWMDSSPNIANFATVPKTFAYQPPVYTPSTPLIRKPWSGNTVMADANFGTMRKKIRLMDGAEGSRNKTCFYMACDLQRMILRGEVPDTTWHEFCNLCHAKTGLGMPEINALVKSAIDNVNKSCIQ